ncbi:dolichol-phosphate mannosyltransferase [Paramicrobacterium humi]|uniref:Dolichol-phosphate mannosyltransferase n=1 Tax=Paramicrobacterium humi TaxID=640635 RepID=A0A1H4JR12_9MICO|nr:polyprenol monophosphomannose synthase [Microbacterium humi]SEB48178.1 dolichol-phosphate mannosyltransferase [Microbacterium humi]
MTRTIAVLPTYNERDNLPLVMRRLRAAVPELEILIVDDASPDGTGVLADQLAASDPRLRVLHRVGRGGLGSAYREGFAWALEHGADVIVEMDADGSHRPEDLPALLGALAGADLAVGSRWVAGGGTIDWPYRRRLLSRAGSAYARLALGIRQHDVTGGYRAFRADALAVLETRSMDSQGYSFQIEVLWHAAQARLRVAEVPIIFAERLSGRSKMSGRIVAEAMVRVTAWGLRDLPRRLRAIDHVPEGRRVPA